MYRDMSNYGKAPPTTTRPVVEVLPPPPAADGLDDDYDYTLAYHPHGNNSNNDPMTTTTTATAATTPTPTSASARGLQQNQYYQEPQHYVEGDPVVDDHFIPEEEEDTVQYDATNIADPVSRQQQQHQQQHHPTQAAPTDSTTNDTSTLLDLDQLEQLQIEAERLKATGNKHMASQEYVKAYHAYSAALQLSPVGPNSHVYLSNRAAALLSLKRYTAAATDARRAIALAPTFGKAHARLGQALYFLKDYENAVVAYEDAVQYEPDNVVTRAYLEKAVQKLMKQQQQQQLQSPMDDAMSSVMSPRTIQNSVTTDPMAQQHTIVQHPYQPNTSSARAAFQQTVEATPAEDDVQDGEGGYSTNNDVSSPPPLPSSSSSAAAVPASLNDASNTTAQSKGEVEHPTSTHNTNDPEFIEAVRIQQRANQYLVTKQYRQAIEEYTAALFLVPDDIQLSPDLHLGRAHALNGSRRHESAKNDALLALKIQPHSPAAYSTLAKSLFYLKDYYGAVLAFDQCRAHLPEGETLGLFDQAYLEKAQRALEEEESSLNEAGKLSSPNRSYLSNTSMGGGSTSTVVPKLPPPRFVPREEAMQQQATTPPARTMPKEWPKQSPDALNIPLRCGPERTVTCISEALGLKLNRGSDGTVRVLSVTDADDPTTNVLRRGNIQIGDVVREAAGVDIRRPITNVMWGDTVALLRMAPRPITIVVATELSPVPKAVLLEQQRATAAAATALEDDPSAAVMAVSPLTRPSPSSGDEAVRRNNNNPTDTTTDVEQLLVVTEEAGVNVIGSDNVDEDDEDIIECLDEIEKMEIKEEIKTSPPTLSAIAETDDNDNGEDEVNVAVVEADDHNDDDDDDDDDDEDGIESVEEEPSPSSVVVNAVGKNKKTTKIAPNDDDVAPETIQSSLRVEEDKIVGGEILFQRDAPPAYGGWDTLRWMSYNGARKVNFRQSVFKLEDGKRKGLPLFWKSGNKHYVERALIVYDEPSLMMIVRRPTSLDEIRNLLGLPDTSDAAEVSDIDDWAINPETAMGSYWILESIADPKTSKLRLSSLTTPTSVSPESADHRERSCFHIMTPSETISLSAVSVRTEAKKHEQSFSDSGAFLETLSLETTLTQTICGAHALSSDLGNSETDIAWKHQVIIGSLHSLVLSGNPKLLEDGIAHARLALSKGTGSGNLTNNANNYSMILPARIVDAVDDNGYTALYYACSNKMDNAIRSLVFAGADVNFRTEVHGLTMIHLCARKLDDKTLSTILSAMSAVKKLDANILDKKGRTPMYVAMVEGSVLDGGKSPAALGRCMAALNAWGGYMMPDSTGTAASSDILRNPVSALSYMWLADYLVVVFNHITYRFPLSMNDKDTPMSLGALYQYPIHSALIALRKNLRKTTNAGVSLADCGLLPTLSMLFERGFEPNERLDTRAFGTTRTSFDEFFGYAPIHILALLALEMDVYKSEFDATTLSENMTLLSDTAELLIKNGARLSLDPPLPERLREKVSTDVMETAEGAAPRRVEILTRKIESDKALLALLGGDKLVSTARKEWCAMKKVATTVTMNLADDNSVFDNSPSAGGSDNLSCAICWSVFGSLMNRKHKCRVTRRYVCDDCSAKRLVQVCSEYRLSDGQFNLARVDALAEQQGRKVSVSTKSDRAITTSNTEAASKRSEESRLAVRLERLEAEQQSNRDSLFGGVLDAAANFVMGGDDSSSNATLPSATSVSMSGLTASLDETRDAFHQRGERLAALNDKSAKMVDASADFAKMASELRKQSEKGFFW